MQHAQANQYLAIIQTDEEEITRDIVEYDALSASEAQAYAFDDLKDNQKVISVWLRIL
jgi:N6-adenosine-specific RNA methylase IME4